MYDGPHSTTERARQILDSLKTQDDYLSSLGRTREDSRPLYMIVAGRLRDESDGYLNSSEAVNIVQEVIEVGQ